MMASRRVKLFQHGADLDSTVAARSRGLISGYTTSPDWMRLIAKLPLFGKDLHQYSRETVKIFHDDARAAGFKIV